jgi:hypothetical protein
MTCLQTLNVAAVFWVLMGGLLDDIILMGVIGCIIG